MKTALLTLFLMGCSLWAQPPPFLAPPSGGPADGARAGLGTNSDQILQQALRNALAGRTNAAVPAATVNPVKAATSADLSAPPPVLRNTPRALPAASPDFPAIPNVPAAVIAPPPRLPAPGLTAAQAATNSPLEEPLPQGMLDFRAADLSQVLDIYSMMVNRTILRPSSLPAPAITDRKSVV